MKAPQFIQIVVADKYGTTILALDEEGGVWKFWNYGGNEIWRNHWHRMTDAREEPAPPPPPPPTLEELAKREVDELAPSAP